MRNRIIHVHAVRSLDQNHISVPDYSVSSADEFLAAAELQNFNITVSARFFGTFSYMCSVFADSAKNVNTLFDSIFANLAVEFV